MGEAAAVTDRSERTNRVRRAMIDVCKAMTMVEALPHVTNGGDDDGKEQSLLPASQTCSHEDEALVPEVIVPLIFQLIRPPSCSRKDRLGS